MAEEVAHPEEGQPEPEKVLPPERSTAPPWPQNGEKWTVDESIAWLETQTWQSETDSTAFIRRMRDASRPDGQGMGWDRKPVLREGFMAEELHQPEEIQPKPERSSTPEQRYTPPRQLREGEKWTMDEVLDWLNTQTWETSDSTAFIRRMRDASR